MLAEEAGGGTDWATFGLATYGAALSTAGIIWQIRSWWVRTKGSVKVFVNTGIMTYSELEGERGPFVQFRAVNDGEKPVTLKTLWLEVEGASQQLWLANTNPPKTLQEGDEVEILAPKAALFKSAIDLGAKMPCKCVACFLSNANREYKTEFVFKPIPGRDEIL